MAFLVELLMTSSTGRQIFASRLRCERKRAGLTQEALGVLAGIPVDVARTRVNRYERAVHDCDLGTAVALAGVLDVPLASLYASDIGEATIISAYSRLSVAGRERLLSLVTEALEADRSSV